MDSSPLKRRRTSPSAFISVTAENTELGQPPQNGVNPSKRRSSLMSPTKASLARFYPSLLPRAKPAEPPRPVTKEKHTSVEENSVRADGTNRKVKLNAKTPSEGLESGINGVEKRQGLPTTPRRNLKPPEEEPASTTKGHVVMNIAPRASPPEEERDAGTEVPGENGQQELVAEAADIGSTGVSIDPDSQESQIPSTPTQRRPQVPTSGIGIGEDGEPSLPSTPSQLGLEHPQVRPKGLLFSTPSRRPRRLRRSNAKTSPLKSPAVPSGQYQKQESILASLGPRRYIANTPKPPPPPEEAHLLQMRNRLSDLEKELKDIEDKVLRQLLVSSWQQERSKEGKDTARRKKDIIQRGSRVVQSRDEVVQLQAAQSIDYSQARQEVNDPGIASTKMPILTQRLEKFLPFSMRSHPSDLEPPSPENKDVGQALCLDTVEATTEPFVITTSDALLLPTTVDGKLLQQQKIVMSTSNRLLTCDMQLTTNIATQQISHFNTQALSSWAEPELGYWLRQDRGEMKLAVLGKAFGSYWELAKLRGKCWINCKQDFSDLVANAPDSSSPLLYLGMQDLVFARSNVQLKVNWRISLSDQGDVESHSSAYPRFPSTWQQVADNELAKIGDAFALLVEDRGITEAIGMICKVVFPT